MTPVLQTKLCYFLLRFRLDNQDSFSDDPGYEESNFML